MLVLKRLSFSAAGRHSNGLMSATGGLHSFSTSSIDKEASWTPPPISKKLRKQTLLTIADLKAAAQRRVPKMFFDYADSGSWTESTYSANERDFSSITLMPKVLVGVANRQLGTTILGENVAMPVALSPVGITGLQHADGEILAARAAEKFGVPFALSTMSICSIEAVAEKTTRPFWFQLYVMKDRDFVRNLIDRAKAAKCSALILTADLQVLGQRHKDIRNGLSAPPKFTLKHIWQMATRPKWCWNMLQTKNHTFGNIVGHAKSVSDLSSLSSWTAEQFDPSLSWRDVAWIKERWQRPLIIKGIMDVEDAHNAVATGADAIVVSNHGGRQLDGAPSSISCLRRIVEAVGHQVEVHVDGGVRSGQDVLKAIALGAKAAHLGRPFIYGLGAAGEEGVLLALDIIQRELDVSMALCGERDIQQVTSSIIANLQEQRFASSGPKVTLTTTGSAVM